MARRSAVGPLDVLNPMVDTNSGVLTPTNQAWFSELVENIIRITRYTVTINPSSVSANTTSEEEFTVSGVSSDDSIVVSKPSHTTGLGIVNSRVSDKDMVAITFMNTTASSIDPPEEDYTITVIKA